MLAMILDIFPIPVLGLVFLYVLLFRPLWFKDAVLEIYELKNRTDSNHSNQEKLIERIYREASIDKPEDPETGDEE